MVCQLKFSEWTADHHLRQPVFLGLREDKDASEVVREKPTA
jgi:bifunctional non-homologous end joining protein LigD